MTTTHAQMMARKIIRAGRARRKRTSDPQAAAPARRPPRWCLRLPGATGVFLRGPEPRRS